MLEPAVPAPVAALVVSEAHAGRLTVIWGAFAPIVTSSRYIADPFSPRFTTAELSVVDVAFALRPSPVGTATASEVSVEALASVPRSIVAMV